MPDPGPGNVFLEDARGWVERRRQNGSNKNNRAGDSLFDIVVHDCFSGGGVPKHLFTTEFWEGLKSLMHVEGVIAVVSLCRLYLAVVFLDDLYILEFRRKSELRCLTSYPRHPRGEFQPLSRFSRFVRRAYNGKIRDRVRQHGAVIDISRFRLSLQILIKSLPSRSSFAHPPLVP
jgi:hypothetical protein